MARRRRHGRGRQRQPANHSSKTSFLQLPLEVRLIIWSSLYTSPHIYACTPQRAFMIAELGDNGRTEVAEHSLTVLLNLFHVNQSLRAETLGYFLPRLQLRLMAALPSGYAATILNALGHEAVSNLRSIAVTRVEFHCCDLSVVPHIKDLAVSEYRAQTIQLACELIRQVGSINTLTLYCFKPRYLLGDGQRVCLDNVFRNLPPCISLRLELDRTNASAGDNEQEVHDVDVRALLALEARVRDGKTIDQEERSAGERSDLVKHFNGLGIEVKVRRKRKR